MVVLANGKEGERNKGLVLEFVSPDACSCAIMPISRRCCSVWHIGLVLVCKDCLDDAEPGLNLSQNNVAVCVVSAHTHWPQKRYDADT